MRVHNHPSLEYCHADQPSRIQARLCTARRLHSLSLGTLTHSLNILLHTNAPQVLRCTADQLAGQDFVLLDLEGCTIYLLGHMPALRMTGLRNCRVYGGPVTGASFMDDVQGCTFVLASYQVCIIMLYYYQVCISIRCALFMLYYYQLCIIMFYYYQVYISIRCALLCRVIIRCALVSGMGYSMCLGGWAV